MSALIGAEVVGDDGSPTLLMSKDEIIGFMMLMVVAGNETTNCCGQLQALHWGHHPAGAWAGRDRCRRSSTASAA